VIVRNYSRFIPGEEIGEVEQWCFGAVGTSTPRIGAGKQPLVDQKALAENTAIRQEGFSEGYVQGHAQAVLETQKQITDYIESEGREQALRFGELMASAKVQLAASEQVLAKGVLSLACEMARKILHQEISVNVNAVKPVIAQGLALLMDGGKNAKIRLNPLDYEELKDRLYIDFEDIALTLVPDPAVACGGCLIESQDTVVDGRIEKRWARTLASLGLQTDWGGADGP
jgi:flagellar assembly protein FliH